MFSRLDRIPACDRQIDGQTDILPQHSPRYAYASRGKNVAKRLLKVLFSERDKLKTLIVKSVSDF